MLVTYHRPWDAKLLMLTIPACALLWAKGGRIARVALLVSSLGLLFTGDIPLAMLSILSKQLHVGTTGIFGQMTFLVMNRPASLVMIAMSIFYLWVYLRRAGPDRESGRSGTMTIQSDPT
jgi:hypothetical protein